MKSFKQRYTVPLGVAVILGALLSVFVSPIVGGIVLILGILGLSFLLAATDTKLIVQMTQALEKLESGLLPEPIVSPRTDELGTLVAAVNRIGRQDKAAQQANTDPLTGLANRRGVLQKLDVAFKKQMPLTMFYIDLDKFKPVNDTYGHEAGDAVLKKVAELFLACTRETDTVSRLGGDEFLIAFYGMDDREKAEERAKKIIEVINEPMWIGDLRVKLGASIGITMAPKDGATVEALMQAADETMYAVKKAGRNGYKFYS
jgi:diguanylate cyclase (GGDEF)-like protein